MSIGTPSLTRRHGIYKFIGILTSTLASLAWLATVITLFGLWGAEDDFTRYESDDGEVPYISSVGARHKTVFIVGAALTGVFFVLTLIFTRLCFDAQTKRRSKRWISLISLICGIIAAISLLLLSIFDSVNHSTLHFVFTGLFTAFTLLSAIFSTIYRFSRNEVNLAVYLRVLFISIVFPLAICFIVFSLINRPANQTQLLSVAAAFEWTIAILFIIYLALFALDLILS
ncbi:unnamed protein product [Adineta ricciae]|uniref:CWH43-like N-terminal domain-containing protein n=1 Tax=Adineta ricciae TaxID=249248 RepID=A0A816A7F5_ADIRI|nr:unnamed protein product [Adineta ricciae]